MSQESQEWHQGGTLESTQRALRDHLKSTQRAVLILADLWEGKLNWNNWPSTSWKTWQLASLNIGKVDTDEWQGPFGWPRFYIDCTYSSTWDCASRCKAHTCPEWHGEGGGIQMMIDFASLKIGEVDTDSTDGSHLVDLVFTLLVLIQAPEGLLADA